MVRPNRPVTEPIRQGEVQSESSSGPEVWSKDRVSDNHVPPFQAPLLRGLGLLPPLAYDTQNVINNLSCADCAPLGEPCFAIVKEDRFNGVGYRENQQGGYECERQLTRLAEHK